MTINDPVASKDAAQHERPGRATGFYNVRLSERDAWFGAIVAVLFTVLGMLMEVAIVRKIPGVSAKPAGISALVALILLIVLFVRRKAPSVRWASLIYLVNSVSVATVLLLTNLQFAVLERNWEPFQATKLACLVAAMLAPGFWIGLVSILIYSLSALLQFEVFFPPEIKAGVGASEPWPMLAFALAGVLALVYRFRRVQLEQEIARIHAQNFAIKRLAHAFLNIRDLMNTPLQVIELSIDLLRKSNDPNPLVIDTIERSMEKLREVNSVLVQHEREIDWQANRGTLGDAPATCPSSLQHR
jgi:hypothetical protein